MAHSQGQSSARANTEFNFDPAGVSPAGAEGLFDPSTFAAYDRPTMIGRWAFSNGRAFIDRLIGWITRSPAGGDDGGGAPAEALGSRRSDERGQRAFDEWHEILRR